MRRENAEQSKETPLYGVVDERTKSIVYQGDAYAGRFIMYAVLLDVFLRGLFQGSPFFAANWDLLLIVIVGSLVSTSYQIKNKVMLNRPVSRILIYLITIVAVSAAIAAALIFIF